MHDTHNTGNKEYMNKLDNIPALPGGQTTKEIYNVEDNVARDIWGSVFTASLQ